MMGVIAIIGTGAMGAGLGAYLVAHGCSVLTPLEGRSAQSRKRALDAGMQSADMEAVAQAPIILSIVPPAQADSVAAGLLPYIREAGDGPLFVDCNPLSPDHKLQMAAMCAGRGLRFADAAIIGSPPSSRRSIPRLYVSGPEAPQLLALEQYGLPVRIAGAQLGAAAAIKLSYAGINKGLVALTTAMILAADRDGVGELLMAELAESLPWLYERARTSIPGSYPKAYRWVAEMQEIAEFLTPDASAAQLFEAVAAFFADRADSQRTGAELASLRALLDRHST